MSEKLADKTKSAIEEQHPSIGGRWPAGEDPVKRQQILEGARNVFMRLGFDAASMNDVTREAGVSKGTLYVYFANKGELFAAMIESQREAFIAKMRMALADREDLRACLYDFGMTFVRHTTDETVVTAMRTVLGVRDRMPTLCQRFFRGPENLRTILQEFLARHEANGTLVMDDIDLAAAQFLEMSSGPFFKLRLFGSMDGPPTEAEMERIVNGAIRTFMAAYGSNKTKT